LRANQNSYPECLIFSIESPVLVISAYCLNSACISFVSELDGMLGDIMVEIAEYESRILLRLVQFIQERITPLHKLVKLASELDW
jgi:hypothetical protein